MVPIFNHIVSYIADYMHDFNAKMAGTSLSMVEYLFYTGCHNLYPTMCMPFKYFTVSGQLIHTMCAF